MKFSKKMVLVDADDVKHTQFNKDTSKGKVFEVNTGISPANEIHNAAVQRLSILDKEILKTLNSKRLNEHEKAFAYGELLRKYIIAKTSAIADRERVFQESAENISKRIARRMANDNGVDETDSKKINHLFINDQLIAPGVNKRLLGEYEAFLTLKDTASPESREPSFSGFAQSEASTPLPFTRDGLGKRSLDFHESETNSDDDEGLNISDHVNRSASTASTPFSTPDTTLTEQLLGRTRSATRQIIKTWENLKKKKKK